MMGDRLMMEMVVVVIVVLTQLLLLYALLQMNLCVSFLLVGPREFPTCIARERLFTGMRSDVSREMIGARERSHANSALERLLTGVNSNVAGEFVRSREATVAVLHGASVGALVNGRLAGTVGVLARLHRD